MFTNDAYRHLFIAGVIFWAVYSMANLELSCKYVAGYIQKHVDNVLRHVMSQ